MSKDIVTNIENLPKVINSGVLTIFNDLPCYVLSDGRRVFRLSKLTYAIRGIEHGKFGNYLNAKAIKKNLPPRLRPLKDEENDRVPQGTIYFEFNGKIEKGYSCEDFMEVCSAFVNAWMNGEELSEAQTIMAYNSNRFIMSAAKVGIIALVDEATGYQIHRRANELQHKIQYFLSEDYREWEKTFPDELWYEFGRLTNWKKSLKLRPKYWGKLVNELIYNKLDKDIAKYLKENKPIKETGKKYFQWLNEERGVKELINHIWQVIGMAKTCTTMNELKELVNQEFD